MCNVLDTQCAISCALEERKRLMCNPEASGIVLDDVASSDLFQSLSHLQLFTGRCHFSLNDTEDFLFIVELESL